MDAWGTTLSNEYRIPIPVAKGQEMVEHMLGINCEYRTCATQEKDLRECDNPQFTFPNEIATIQLWIDGIVKSSNATTGGNLRADSPPCRRPREFE